MFILAQLPPYSWPWPCWHSMAMQQAHAYINSLLPGVNNTVPIHATRDKFSKTKMMHLWINLHIPRHILVKWSHTTGFSTFLILILFYKKPIDKKPIIFRVKKLNMSGTVRSPKRPLGLVALYRDAECINLVWYGCQARESRQREVVDMRM